MSCRLSSRRSFLLATVGALTEASFAGTEPVQHRVSIALAARQSLYHLPLTLADQLGFFRQSGLVIDWVSHEAGAKAMASAMHGQADVVAGAFEHLFGLHQKGLNYQGFIQVGRTPQLALGVSTRLGTAMRSVMDLKGARVGISALDSGTHWMACQWLLHHGLSPEDVLFVEVGTSFGAMDALRSGSIDALCNPDPVMYWLEQKNEIRILGDTRSMMATRKLMSGYVPGACLLARTEFLQRQPAVAQALCDSVIHALKWLQTAGSTDILKTVPSHHWMGDRATYLGAFEKLRESYATDGLISVDSVFNAARAYSRLSSQAPITRSMLERMYTNSFAGKSKARFAA